MSEMHLEASEQTDVQPEKNKMKKSRRVVFVALAVLLIAIVLVSVMAFNNRGGSPQGNKNDNTSPSSNSGYSPPINSSSKSGVTLVDLQMDYDAWKGDFKSYDENDTVVLRDTITSIEVANNAFGQPITALYFRAHPLPSLDDLLSGRVQNESWYTWTRGNWEHAATISSIFPVKYDSTSGKYLPEVRIGFQGDVRNRFSVGSTIEITLHFDFGTAAVGYEYRTVESIYEFKWAIKP